jgi:hypothetical protein
LHSVLVMPVWRSNDGGSGPGVRLRFLKPSPERWSITGASALWQFRWKMPGSVQVALVLLKEIGVGKVSVPDEPI